MKTGPHRSDRARQRVGGFGVTHFLEVAEHDSLAITNREIENRPADALDALGSSQIAEWIRLLRSLVEPVSLRERLKRAVAFQTLSRAVPCDPAKPRDYAGSTSLIPGGIPHYDHENILRDVVSRARGSRHVQCEPVDLTLPAAKEERERLRIASSRPREQILVDVPLGIRCPVRFAPCL
jgi:hypothetical protein